MDTPASPPSPVRGRVITSSKMSMLGIWLLGLVFLFGCGYLLYERWVLGIEDGVLPFRLTWWGSLLALAGFLIGLGCTFAMPFEFLMPRRLVLGDHALQVVRKSPWGEPTVELHLPYAAVAAVVYEKRKDNWQLGLDLADPATGAYAKYPADLTRRDSRGHDVILDGGYTVGLEDIARQLDKRRLKAGKRATAEGGPV